MKYIIIGASAAGIACAEQIRKEDAHGEIIVLSEERFLPYSRPSISYYLKGAVSEKAMRLRTPGYYASRKITLLCDMHVTGIDVAKKIVKVGRKQFAFDKLCLCTGSVPFVPPVQNIEGKENVFTFLDLAAVKAIKAKANQTTRAVVIGAGLIGMKAAEGLSKVCKSVDVVELSPRILPSILDPQSSKRVKAYVEEHGHLHFHLGDTVKAVKSRGKKITGVVLGSGKELPCDMLVVAVGVRPQTALAQKAGLQVARGIVTDPVTMQTSQKDIFAAGDCVLSHDMLDESDKIIALWGNAVLQGKVAGSRMAGGDLALGGSFAVNAIDFYGLRICTCGLINATGDAYREVIKQDKDSYKRLIIRDHRLVGFVLIGASENAGIYTSLIENQTDLRTLKGDLAATPTIFLFHEQAREKRLKGEAI